MAAKKKNKTSKSSKSRQSSALRTQKKQGFDVAAHANDLVRVGSVGLAFIAMVIMNALAVFLPLAGNSTGEISDMYPVLVTPAGYAFSIWSLIYTGMLAYVIYQALPQNWDNPRLKAISWLFVISCVFNIGWLVIWHNLLISWSIIFMVGILVTLIMIYQKLETGKSEVDWLEHYCVRVPFSIYMGWITLATVINTSVLLWNWGWQSGSLFWAIIALLAATAINAVMLVRRRDYPYAGVAVWALFALNVKHWGTSNEVVGVTALFFALILLTVMLFLQDIPDNRELPEQYAT